ncbi:chitotriosidase-1-like [Paramacrobiotus metropolitanus]|uniref:chitotriosidase-1-like n=1 Tax=Paramacrobiotus metropolitanus TaxID=2943436 RepID=UPI0024459B14|nr:chitotriosidase-1-like [Paramacrobiotus metropolitanus]
MELRFGALFCFIVFFHSNTRIREAAASQFQEPDLPFPQFQCFFTSWSRYRDAWAFLPSNVDPFLCTTIVYAFVQILDDRIAYYDWKDEENLLDLVELKKINPKLRIHLSVGGWTLSYQFKPMARSPESRQTFINSSIAMMRALDLDGIDVDWEYPEAEDLQVYMALLQEMRAAFNQDAVKTGKRRLALTVDVGALMHGGYDVPAMNSIVDLVNIMAYDYHGSWEQQTGHNAPMYKRSTEVDYQAKLNVEYSANLWKDAGISKSKLAIGIPTYGRSWILANTSNHGFNAPTRGPGPKGPFTKELGSLSYFEICGRLKDKSLTIQTNKECRCSYAYGTDDLWVSFDNVGSVTEKANWLKRNGYNGVLVWELGLDDWKGECGGRPMTLFTTIYEIFYGRLPPPRPPTTTAKPGTYVPPTTPRPTRIPVAVISKTKCDDAFCSYRPAGDYPTGPCNEAYCTCVGGISYSRSCPPSVFYDPVNKVCSWPSMIPGCAAVDEHKAELTKQELKTCMDTGNCNCDAVFCSRHGLGDFALGPCQESFCACAAGGVPYTKHCPDPLVFDPRLSVCNWKASTSTC